jgi:hypothetical protein
MHACRIQAFRIAMDPAGTGDVLVLAKHRSTSRLWGGVALTTNKDTGVPMVSIAPHEHAHVLFKRVNGREPTLEGVQPVQPVPEKDLPTWNKYKRHLESQMDRFVGLRGEIGGACCQLHTDSWWLFDVHSAVSCLPHRMLTSLVSLDCLHRCY